MPSVDHTTPQAIKTFTTSHGLDLSPTTGGEYQGMCPNCGKKKFRVNEITAQWTCRNCQTSGNAIQFVRWIYELSKLRTKYTTKTTQEFAESRSLMQPDVLEEWGVVQSVVTKEWLVPGYDIRGEIMQVYIYRCPPGKSKPILQATANLEHQLFGMDLIDRRRGTFWLFESFWDALCMYEVLTHAKETPEGIIETRNRNLSMVNGINILATPGTMVFRDEWGLMFGGKHTSLYYHSDYPKILPDGTLTIPAGHAGLKRVIKILSTMESPPESISYMSWGDKGYAPNLEDGFDIRDWLLHEQPTDNLDKSKHETNGEVKE